MGLDRRRIHGPDCDCGYCSKRYSGGSASSPSRGRVGDYFEGDQIKVITGATGRRERLEFYYGGLGAPDGLGHGHVVCNNGETINFWRESASEGGRVVIDDRMSTEQLSEHLF